MPSSGSAPTIQQAQAATPPPPDYAAQYTAATQAYLANYPDVYNQAMGLYNSSAAPLAATAGAANLAGASAQDPGMATLLQNEANQLDPAAQGIRASLASNVEQGLQEGDQLDPAQQAEIENNVRGASEARGSALDSASTAQEVIAKYNLGQQLQQTRMGNAASYLSGTVNPAQILSGASATPTSAIAPSVNTNAGQAGPAIAAQNYSAQNQAASSIYNTATQSYLGQQQLANAPLNTAIGAFAGGAGMAATAFI